MNENNQKSFFQSRKNLFDDLNHEQDQNGLENLNDYPKQGIYYEPSTPQHPHHPPRHLQHGNVLNLRNINLELAEEQEQEENAQMIIPETPTSHTHHQHGKETTRFYDIGQFGGPPKKLKPSPCEIDVIPDTPQKESYFVHHEAAVSAESSRLYKDYEIIDVLGSGSFGTVYRVRGKLDGVGYAIKKSRRRPHSQQERASMMSEVHALAALSAQEDSEKTSCIVRYYSAWMEDQYLCIQMELCESSAGDATIFDHQSAYQLLRDLLNALDVLHSNDFVHLDIKPANILVKKNRFKLADFGLALHTTNRKFNGNVEEGDSRYMARELLNWGQISDLTKCDLFSLGISVFELYSRQSLEPNGEHWQALRNGIIDFPPNTPEHLVSLISQLMSPEPKDRPSAQHCLEHFIELKTPLEIELERQRTRAMQLEQELQQLIQNKLTIGSP